MSHLHDEHVRCCGGGRQFTSKSRKLKFNFDYLLLFQEAELSKTQKMRQIIGKIQSSNLNNGNNNEEKNIDNKNGDN